MLDRLGAPAERRSISAVDAVRIRLKMTRRCVLQLGGLVSPSQSVPTLMD